MPIADVLELIDLQWDAAAKAVKCCGLKVLPHARESYFSRLNLRFCDDSITVRELLSMTFKNAGYRGAGS